MNKDEIAQKIINEYRKTNKVFRTPNGGTLTFARVNEEEWDKIKNLSNEELIEWFESIHFYFEEGFSSVRDCELYSLLQIEIVDRGLVEKVKDDIRNKTDKAKER